LYSEKRKKEIGAIWVAFEARKVSMRNGRARDRESSMFEFKGLRDIDVSSRSASTTWGFPQHLIALFPSLFSYAIPPNTPRASDTVATSGFPQLLLCFTSVWWTAEFGACELVIVPNQLAKQCPLYRLFLVLSKGLNFFVFYSLLVT
jgi:hypothetical protein